MVSITGRSGRARVGFALGAAVAVAGIILLAGPWSFAPAGASQPQVELQGSGNFYLNTTGPSGFVDPGSRLTVQYRIYDPTYPASSGPATVRVPATLATFATTGGSVIRVFLSPTNFVLRGDGAVSEVANGSMRLATGETFVAGANATISSNGYAVQASWAPGTYPVRLQWQWVVTLADGTQTAGPWSGWSTISPAQIATIVGQPPSSLAVGGAFPICLAGPIAGREFTVHIATTAPIQTFNGPTVTVPASFGSFFCWNTTIPSTWGPQTVLAHIWELSSLSYMLYQQPIQLTNASGGVLPPAGGGGGAAWPAALWTPIWLGWVSPLVLLLSAAVILGLLWAAGRRRARGSEGVASPEDPPESSRAPPTVPVDEASSRRPW